MALPGKSGLTVTGTDNVKQGLRVF
jgi:hypothetical protein